jgi:uncharacterized membrane protein YgdD (TMEM256/DUF423 family)
MKIALCRLKRALLPRFVYEYSIRHSSQHAERVIQRLRDLGCEQMQTRNGESSCYLSKRSVFGGLSFGRLFITLSTPSTNEVRYRVLFLTQRFCFYLTAGLLSLAVVGRSIYMWNCATLLVLPVILFSGHLYFWGMLPAKVSRLKTFLHQLGDQDQGTLG